MRATVEVRTKRTVFLSSEGRWGCGALVSLAALLACLVLPLSSNGLVQAGQKSKKAFLPWKPGDAWYVQVTQHGATGARPPYDMRITILGTEKLGPSSCWRILFMPVSGPAQGGRCIAFLDRESGFLRTGSIEMESVQSKLVSIPGLPIADEPPSGYPYEVLPLLTPGQWRSEDGSRVFGLNREYRDDIIHWEAELSQNGAMLLVIRQRWRVGDNWWLEYERYVGGAKELTAKRATSSVRDMDSAVREKAAKDAAVFARLHPLGLDMRLRARLTVVENEAKLDDVLARLRAATGLTLTLADNLTGHNPDLGQLQMTDTFAYSFMEILAERDLENGRWEKTADGYRLEGNSTHFVAPPPTSTVGWWLAAVGLVLLIAATLFVVRWRIAQARPQEK